MKLAMLWALTAVLVAQDPRVKLVDGMEKLGEKADINQPCVDFSAKSVRMNTATLVASTSGAFFLFAGGTGQPDGISLSVVGALKGRTLLMGGAGGKGGKGGRTAFLNRGGGYSSSGPSGAGSADPRMGKPGVGGGFSATVADTTVKGMSGATGDAGPAGDDQQFATEASMKALDAAVEPISAQWEKAPPKDRQKWVDEFASKHRPSAGVVAAWSTDGKFLLVIAANGTATNPNGISLEVVGKVAQHVVVIAGDKHGKGTAGKAKGPSGSLTRDGK